ncbi:unnamed protein product [Parascedosporium putredinis]|uniref:Transcription factor n=1 Tax=Parascedosporium putredinis TaxID=1442378 RepID=A0A9P1HBH8_9PEZI|nr:unnamed protein product [Parascedosporium putredinis]CAI8003965.1 unnamed protein product [Parascedosporium putredinis]
MPDKPSPAQGGGNTSSDFVRKLYRMLEEPEYDEIVRWGRDGDSFVVLEGEKFSTCVLPKHFKHSNFASFVRQLNKYDFHKVRRPDDGSQGYGPNAWEFKHPDFRIDAKDSLDTIRRKAPSTKKSQQQQQQQQQRQPPQAPTPDQNENQRQIQTLTDTLYALQKQVEELAQTNKQLVSEIVNLQKSTSTQRQAQYEIVSFLDVSARRQSVAAGQSPAGPMTGRGLGEDQPVELRRVRELLGTLGPAPAPADTSMERSHTIYPSPAESSTSSAMFVAPDMNAGIAVMNDAVGMSRMGVYSTNQPTTIDAFHADPLQTMAYPVAQNSALEAVATDSGRVDTSPPAEKTDEWGPRKPHIFLVEDDKICAKIGNKFLRSLGCTVALAKDGLEAVKQFDCDHPPHYDLIFMDIIMPRLDGISATARIREYLPDSPIVAMTSNIRQEDVSTYFKYGMTDVLAKPFMREGMQRTLRKHLRHLLSQTSPQAPAGNGPYAHVQAGTAMTVGEMAGPDPASLAAGHIAIKFENPPMQLPATTQGVLGMPRAP